MRKLFVCLLVLCALTLSAADIDVTGKWTGSFEVSGPDGQKSSTALLVLTQKGTEITGTAGPNEDQQSSIQKGKLEGDKLTLEVEDNGTLIRFALMVAGDRITGDARPADSADARSAKLDVKRTK
ncbi:MAG TPA: hypothetical protein VGH38_30190 [Bryobacteraceae bacterium]|jgi:hypothetical protein